MFGDKGNTASGAPRLGPGHCSVVVAAKKKRRERCAEAMVRSAAQFALEEGMGRGWGRPVRGAHLVKPRNLPQREVVDLDALRRAARSARIHLSILAGAGQARGTPDWTVNRTTCYMMAKFHSCAAGFTCCGVSEVIVTC